MIRGNQSLLLKRLFSTPKEKPTINKVCPRIIINKTKISPTPCFVSHENNQYCSCKRRRKDIDKILLEKQSKITLKSKNNKKSISNIFY